MLLLPAQQVPAPSSAASVVRTTVSSSALLDSPQLISLRGSGAGCTAAGSTLHPTSVEHERDVRFMRLALLEAEAALAEGEVPVGCVFVHNDRSVALGHNLCNSLRDATRHAELVALDRLIASGLPRPAGVEVGAGSHSRVGVGIEVFVSCEPCIMCASALRLIGASRVVFGCHNLIFGGCGSVLDLFDTESNVLADGPTSSPSSTHRALVYRSGILATDAARLLRQAPPSPAFVRPHAAALARASALADA